ncbi:MAG: acyl-CoA thioesterase [Planctomycetota bacterium]
MNSVVFEPTIWTYDIDFNQHVSNIVYVRWMEQGRCNLLEAAGFAVTDVVNMGFGPVLVDTQIAYKRPLELGDRVSCEVWLSEIAKASAWMDFVFRKLPADAEDLLSGDVIATGRQRGVFVSLENGRPRKFTDDDLAKMGRYLRPAE